MTYLFFGYFVIWLALAMYLFLLSRRADDLRRQIAELRKDRPAEDADRP